MTTMDPPSDQQTGVPVVIPRPRAMQPLQRPLPRPRSRSLRVVDAQHPLSGRHAVVVGINYAPEPTGIAPYTRGMAEHLAAHATSVTVLTGMPHYPSWKLPPEYRLRFRTRENIEYEPVSGVPVGLMVRRLRHYVPGRQSALTRAGYEMTFLANAWTVRLEQRPGLVIAVTPSLSGAVAGARLAERHGARLLVIVQDLMARAAAHSGISGGGGAAAANAALERYALRRADRVAVVSESFTHQLENYGVPPERISVLPNWTHITPSTATRAEARAMLGWPLAPFTVVHTGNIGLKQDLGNLVAAARLCASDPSMRFVIVGEGSQRRHVQSLAAGLENLTFVDPMDPVHYPLALAAADVLLVNERTSAADMSLPSKLTSYLSAGRPVVAAVSPKGATARELERTGGAGLIARAGSPVDLASILLRLREDAQLQLDMAQAGQAFALTHLGRDTAMRRLDAIVAQTLAGS